MKRLILPVIVFLPITLIAQQTDVSRTKDQQGPAASQLIDTYSTGGSAETSLTSGADGTFLSSLLESEAGLLPRPTASTPTKAQKTKKPSRPRAKGSMVGYVDDAIVGSQVRVRFDTGFHNNAPDRAEFFYAQYAGIDGPGPNSVVANLNFEQLYLRAEYAPTQRFSLFAEIPIRWIQPQLILANLTPSTTLTSEGGISDVAAGFKLAAIASAKQYLTFQLQAYFPSGNASSGLGTGHYSVEPALLYYQRLSAGSAVEAEVGDSHPIGGSSCLNPCQSNNATGPGSEGFAGDVFFYGVGPSYAVYRSDRVVIAPVIELVGWRVLGGLETVCVPSVQGCSDQEAVSADGTNIVNLKAGVRATVGTHSSFYVGYGHQLTHNFWYKEIVRAEYRYSF
jgi:hypothetical protein